MSTCTLCTLCTTSETRKIMATAHGLRLHSKAPVFVARRSPANTPNEVTPMIPMNSAHSSQRAPKYTIEHPNVTTCRYDKLRSTPSKHRYISSNTPASFTILCTNVPYTQGGLVKKRFQSQATRHSQYMREPDARQLTYNRMRA